MGGSVVFLEHQAVALVLHQIGVLAEHGSVVLDAVTREVQPDRLLHEAIRELLERCRHDLHVDRVARRFDSLHCTLELLGEVELGHRIDALLLSVRVSDAKAEWRGEGHCDAWSFLKARLQHLDHLVLAVAVWAGQESAVFE